VVVTVLFLFSPTSRIHKLDDQFETVGERIRNADYDGIRSIYATDTSHLYVYDTYDENITHIFDVPGEAQVSVKDMVVAGTRGAYIVALLPYGGLIEYWNDTLRNITLSVSEETYFECISCSPDGNVLYMGGANTGVVVYDLVGRILTNVTIEDGLLSNQIHEIHATRDSLLIGSSDGFQVYNLQEGTFVNETTEPDSSAILQPTCIEYLEASKELYLGTENGLHIYRYSKTELVYLKTLGPADKLPSAMIEDIDLDITSHRLIISTRRGICIYDVFSGTMNRLEETTVNFCTTVFHKYNGPVCQIYFGTWNHGLLRLDIDYTPVNPIDLESTIQIATGICIGLVVSVFTALFQDWLQDRKKRREYERQIDDSFTIKS
jgi:hypothetical protein